MLFDHASITTGHAKNSHRDSFCVAVHFRHIPSNHTHRLKISDSQQVYFLPLFLIERACSLDLRL